MIRLTNHSASIVGTALLAAALCLPARSLAQQPDPGKVFPGADENTVSQAHYFTWINNTAGGAPERQTLINLDFFRWLLETYGMRLDIYAFDADILDGAGYFSLKSEKFLKNYPSSFGPVSREAASLGIRLGVWLGPDGFGDTPQAEQDRIDMLVSLCRDFHFRLFKMDTVSPLRPEKQDAFIRAMRECRSFSPDLIVLNHRIDFGKAAPYVTTTLWNGDETYIDVHMVNSGTATHHRAGAISRGLTPGLKRLLEDHGVCLSSCLDYWEDDLVMQAFNRSLLLAPELYGNPWFLRDDEYPRLARLFNVHRAYRDILVKGLVLPEERYGPSAVSRGDGETRLITLSNLTWDAVRPEISLDRSIGLEKPGDVTLVQVHPFEKVIGRFPYGTKVPVEVLPFRAALLVASMSPRPGVGLEGAAYEIVQDVPGRDVVVKVMGYPGSRARISLPAGSPAVRRARLDGRDLPDLVKGRAVEIAFPGRPLTRPWHRKIGEPAAGPVPGDAQALYEATCFAADNNALEVRSLERSGPTKIPQVRAARDAFFSQPVFVEKGVWDKYLFDGDWKTAFNAAPRLKDFRGGALRIDLGKPVYVDTLRVHLPGEDAVRTLLSGADVTAEVSPDLRTWSPARLGSRGSVLEVTRGSAPKVRHFRLSKAPSRILEIEGLFKGARLDRTGWRASNLFKTYAESPALKAWTLSFVLDEAARGSYLAVPLAGKHGREGAYVAFRVGGRLVGAPDRSVSYPTNVWEFRVEPKDENYTYYLPVTSDMVGRKIDVVVLGMSAAMLDFKPEVWITAYPVPFESKTLVLERAAGER